uniref:RES family NAD+ phosphorylase n=1 Tax=Ningiella ruwaisensis TaxID=2364274 RepID=UPI0010A07984|nr:RES family NAD+ phosphorylase [Ningiella ruwaisensis]
MQIVDTLEEQSLLEDIIESSKPPLDSKADSSDRHYLLKTPFRYPPLKYGSRFGRRFEPSLFYASHTIKGALCESAFYSFYFMSRSETPFKGVITNKKTSFAVDISTKNFVDLCLIEDPELQRGLQHKSDYTCSQRVGTYMRKEGVDAFSYYSAREEGDKHVGIFYLDIITGSPEDMRHWQIKQTPERLLYYCAHDTSLNSEFSIDTFLSAGTLPHPSQ